MANPLLMDSQVRGDQLTISINGCWTGEHASELDALSANSLPDESAGRGEAATGKVDIDLHGLERLDTLGAWLIERMSRGFAQAGREVRLVGLPQHYQKLFDEVRSVNRKAKPPAQRQLPLQAWFEQIGRSGVAFWLSLLALLDMFGGVAVAVGRAMVRPSSFRLTSCVHHLSRVGVQALPIMLLITFLIGGIIAQQGFFHFRKFGADSYVVDMVGILVLRELGVLIVSIMVAGRSGSAYTAELGSMKMREEIDALRTMGFDPVEVLILPRLIALVLAVPALVFFGSLAALYGGGLVAWLYGGMSPETFLARLREAISITHLEVGMIKAPFMALAIGLVACAEGLAVQGSAESLGIHTTQSVVKSIFLVIVLDGVFAIFFASIGM
ncbi:ABC transporter permease [Rhodoblastus sphagnicola]|uniref:ABC transporter permease n=1 Tax=Rhodoblastus sphagnicola TaxID=333368 RepID=A0A2S6N4E7_9HYPH|nr:MlaE family lipid ABC transporter permease subunit [Rhodoblastus sphagnicola]MBB4200318.1 phospholipid/cholesterol/gamma-HCH transport system permease protein [Rhodoblastus sphagnicola]PPQ29480.1 ABC transporter permease [Rhodoblastus sphagnicola]